MTDNSGVTGLTSTTTGLSISTITDVESSPTSYTSAGSTIETITTLGTFAAPTATKCRFKEVSSTLHPGIYEIQIADARFAITNAKSILITILAVTASNVAQVDCLIPLVRLDPYNLYDGYTLPQLIAITAAACVAKVSGLPTSPATIRSVDDSANRIVTAFDSSNNRTSVTITAP